MSDSPRPLEYYSTKDILNEVRKRFDDAVFVGYQEKTNTISDYILFLHGSHHGVAGLINIVAKAAERSLDADTPD
jgi:hypothetical protein